MRDEPDITAILYLANKEPQDAALVARARAIAEREAAGAGAYDGIRAALKRHYGDASDGTLLQRLASDIRAGRFDVPSPESRAVGRLLWALAVQKLRECNPDFLSLH